MTQTSVQLTEQTKAQATELRAMGFGTFTTIVRIAIDRMWQRERLDDVAFNEFELEEFAEWIKQFSQIDESSPSENEFLAWACARGRTLHMRRKERAMAQRLIADESHPGASIYLNALILVGNAPARQICE